MALPFIDTNMLLRHLRGDHPEHSPKATALLGRIERGELEAQLSDIVVFETVFTLERGYKVPKMLIRDAMLALLALPGLILQGKRRYGRIFDFYIDHHLPFGDAYIAAEMERFGASEIYTFDREFDRLPGVTRLEPDADHHDADADHNDTIALQFKRRRWPGLMAHAVQLIKHVRTIFVVKLLPGTC